jgi:hypothetical protein
MYRQVITVKSLYFDVLVPVQNPQNDFLLMETLCVLYVLLAEAAYVI